MLTVLVADRWSPGLPVLFTVPDTLSRHVSLHMRWHAGVRMSSRAPVSCKPQRLPATGFVRIGSQTGGRDSMESACRPVQRSSCEDWLTQRGLSLLGTLVSVCPGAIV